MDLDNFRDIISWVFFIIKHVFFSNGGLWFPLWSSKSGWISAAPLRELSALNKALNGMKQLMQL